MASSFGLSLDLTSLDQAVDAAHADLVAAARPASQAGAQVLYEEALQNVRRLGKKSGKLAAAIYQAYSSDQSQGGVATYHISWNAKKAPHGHLVEFGYLQRYEVVLTRKGEWVTLKNKPLPAPRQVGAKSPIRRAMDKRQAAQEAMVAELFKRLDEGKIQ